MLLLKLARRGGKPDVSTEGDFFVDGVRECSTVEDATREKKIFGKTAIPCGRYRVIVTYSNHFKKDLPLLLNVPNYEGVRIHSGNTSADTEGCIIVGAVQTSLNDDYVGESKKAFDKLFTKIKQAIDAGQEVWLTIVDERKAAA